MATTRNMTQIRLFRLPPEVILLITEDDSLGWEDLRRLRHVCSFFFHYLGRRVFKFADFFFFRNACSHANVDILIECLNKNATPTNTAWKSPHPSAGDYVVNGFRVRNFSVERFKHTWQWLSDHGFELSYSKGVTGDVPEHYRPFSADLLYLVWDATEAEHLQATCDVIHFVVDEGMMFPRYLSFSFEATGEPRSRGLIQFMLDTHCPASILKLFLKQLHGHGLTLKSPVNSQIYGRETTETYTFLWEMYRYIFDSLPPWSSGNQENLDTPRVLLRLEDPNGIADNFGDKVKALIEYNSVDDGEARVWTDIWRSLEKMARKRIEQGSLDFDQDGVWFWYELNMSIAYLATDRTVLKGRARDSQDDPIHVFKIQNEGWYPPERLAFIRMRFAEERGTIDPSKLEDRSIGDWWNMPLCDWDFLFPEHKIDSNGWLEHRAAEDDILRMRGALVE